MVRVLFSLAFLLAPTISHAQKLRDFIEMFGGLMARPQTQQAASADWQHLAETERGCLRIALGKTGKTIEQLAIAGVGPDHPALKDARAECRSGAPAESTTAAYYPFVVNGIVLGSKFDSVANSSKYKCSPSRLFVGATWCEKFEQGVYTTMLHWNAEIFYVSAQLNNASFKPGEMNQEIVRLSQKFGSKAYLREAPKNSLSKNGMIANWGAMRLEALDQTDLSALANNGDFKKGIVVDFVGDSATSAKSNMPVYFLSGGRGFIWAASAGPNGKGHLRFAAGDFSRFEANSGPMTQTVSHPQPRAEQSQAADLAAPTSSPSTVVPTGPRVALVIGNGQYLHSVPLTNPVNDAHDIAAALRDLGFKVIEGHDLDSAAMRAKISEFGAAMPGAGTTLFFYAGHGVQVSGNNYLIPVDAKLERPSALHVEAVNVNTILADMETEKRINLVFLDACRDNPLSRSLARSFSTSRSSQIGQGLAQVNAGIGTLITFATSPNNVALDGTGRNSPFTSALLKHIRTPNLEVRSLLTRVRADVIRATNDKQVPWDHSSLTGEFYFKHGG